MRKFFVCFLVLAATPIIAQAPDASWLDRALSNWNIPGRPVPRAATDDETASEISKRCMSTLLRGTSGERALADAGWLPFHMFDRQIVQRDVEIVGGMSGADGMCRPIRFNVFVFVGGRLAGALSPHDMDSRSDASIGGGVRLAEDDTISADFARYTAADPSCCPSSRVTVRYWVDRKASFPVVVPVRAQATRQ